MDGFGNGCKKGGMKGKKGKGMARMSPESEFKTQQGSCVLAPLEERTLEHGILVELQITGVNRLLRALWTWHHRLRHLKGHRDWMLKVGKNKHTTRRSDFGIFTGCTISERGGLCVQGTTEYGYGKLSRQKSRCLQNSDQQAKFTVRPMLQLWTGMDATSSLTTAHLQESFNNSFKMR